MLALLYDIHGNLPALEAVLDDLSGRGVERFVLGGDVAPFGAWPASRTAGSSSATRTFSSGGPRCATASSC
jgi:hypothetical protein